MFTRHHPNGDGCQHFDNGRLEELIAAYQSGSNPSAALGEIVERVQQRALALIRFHKTSRYQPEDELLSDINYKLLRSVGKFDPTRGSAFTFISHVVINTLRTNVTRSRVTASRFIELDESIAERLSTGAGGRDQEAIEDVEVRLRRGMRTTLDDPAELAAQRWYVASFIGGAFELRRHTCANAAMQVFELSHERSREIHDLTLLEIRRLLYDDMKPGQPIHPGQLLGRRELWMARFAPVMNDREFTKFVILTRNLGPFVLMLLAPRSRSRRQDRNPAIGRENILWVLNGHPAAVPLFTQKSPRS
jgi:hypothetical protein